MNLVGLLEARHTAMLEWVEPWPACGPEGNTLDAHITLRATVHDCINLQRAADRHAGRPMMGDDERRLDEFLTVHWAWVVRPNDGKMLKHTCPACGKETIVRKALPVSWGGRGVLDTPVVTYAKLHSSECSEAERR